MFGTYIEMFDMELKTKHGIDKLDVMIRFMKVLNDEKRKKHSSYDRFKSFLVQQLQRGLTAQEEVDMVEGMLKYVRSEPGSNERLDSMKYLFELEFIPFEKN